MKDEYHPICSHSNIETKNAQVVTGLGVFVCWVISYVVVFAALR